MHKTYLLKRQTLALTGKFRFYDPNENLIMYSEQKMFKLKEDIHVYSDESKSQEPQQGEVVIRFSNYQINQGLKDEYFLEPEQ